MNYQNNQSENKLRKVIQKNLRLRYLYQSNTRIDGLNKIKVGDFLQHHPHDHSHHPVPLLKGHRASMELPCKNSMRELKFTQDSQNRRLNYLDRAMQHRDHEYGGYRKHIGHVLSKRKDINHTHLQKVPDVILGGQLKKRLRYAVDQQAETSTDHNLKLKKDFTLNLPNIVENLKI